MLCWIVVLMCCVDLFCWFVLLSCCIELFCWFVVLFCCVDLLYRFVELLYWIVLLICCVDLLYWIVVLMCCIDLFCCVDLLCWFVVLNCCFDVLCWFVGFNRCKCTSKENSEIDECYQLITPTWETFLRKGQFGLPSFFLWIILLNSIQSIGRFSKLSNSLEKTLQKARNCFFRIPTKFWVKNGFCSVDFNVVKQKKKTKNPKQEVKNLHWIFEHRLEEYINYTSLLYYERRRYYPERKFRYHYALLEKCPQKILSSVNVKYIAFSKNSQILQVSEERSWLIFENPKVCSDIEALDYCIIR